MALNITLAGNILNSQGTSIEANVQVFAYNKENGLTTWSDIRVTEDTDYNINLGDPDISGQDNILGLTDSANEFALIAAWTQDSSDRLTPASEFAFIIHEFKGDEVYIQNIQLGLPQPITCENWSLPSQINTGESLIAINNNTNELTYEAQGITHYLYKKYFDINEIIFNYMGTCSQEFDFGEGYSSSNVYTPTVGGDILVKIKVSDCFGNVSECQKTAKVYYDITPCFDYSPSNIVAGTEIFLTSCTVGNIDKISETKYTINGTEIIGTDVSKIIEEFGPIEVKQCNAYFNGYEDKIKCVTKTISMENIPPELNLEVLGNPYLNLDTKDYSFAHNGKDIDGIIEKVKWEIWRNNPDADGNDHWNLYYTTGPISDLSNWQYNFTDLVGQFKVKATVYDNIGASTSQEQILDNLGCPETEIFCFENLDWNKKIKVIDFSLTDNIISWTTRITRIPWETKIIKMMWNMEQKRIVFDPLIKKILFTYKLTDIGRKGSL